MNVNDVSIFCRHFSVLLNYSSKSIHINTGIYIYNGIYIDMMLVANHFGKIYDIIIYSTVSGLQI